MVRPVKSAGCIVVGACLLFVACGKVVGVVISDKAGASTDGDGTETEESDSDGIETEESDSDDFVTPDDPGETDVTFILDTRQAVHSISSYIYGMNTLVELYRNRPGLLYWGSNRVSAFNWETNDSNAGMDYRNQNDWALVSNEPDWNKTIPGQAVRPNIEADISASILSIPINDWVASDHDIGGDVALSGSDYLSLRFKMNLPVKDADYALAPDTDDDYVYQDEFVNWARNTATVGKVIFALDHEPDKWQINHPRIRLEPLTLEELADCSVRYAEGVKKAWPEAEIAGFVGSSWLGYTTLLDATRTKDDPWIYEEYLKAMKKRSDAAGGRLLNYLMVHYFPEAVGDDGKTIVNSDYDPEAGAEARMQAPRSLWDTTYIETPGQGINAWLGGEALALIPRLKQSIDANYPGTLIAITNWYFGASDHISGAVAMADALGIFGRENIAIAACADFMDSNENEREFLYAGFRAFTNYDDAGAAFGDMSFLSTTSDIAKTGVYGSFDSSSPSRMVIVAVNKTTSSLTAGIEIAHTARYNTLHVYQLTDAAPELVSVDPISKIATNAFRYNLPPRSVSVLLPIP